MSNKLPGVTNISSTEADELRVVVSELNESIAYLSKMVLQLQRSINSSKGRKNTNTDSLDEQKIDTVH